jgi:hypothetical protein
VLRLESKLGVEDRADDPVLPRNDLLKSLLPDSVPERLELEEDDPCGRLKVRGDEPEPGVGEGDCPREEFNRCFASSIDWEELPALRGVYCRGSRDVLLLEFPGCTTERLLPDELFALLFSPDWPEVRGLI